MLIGGQIVTHCKVHYHQMLQLSTVLKFIIGSFTRTSCSVIRILWLTRHISHFLFSVEYKRQLKQKRERELQVIALKAFGSSMQVRPMFSVVTEWSKTVEWWRLKFGAWNNQTAICYLWSNDMLNNYKITECMTS